MNLPMNRRDLLTTSAALLAGSALPATQARADASKKPCPHPSGAGQRKMQLGMVTYNVAGEWDLPTLIKRCEKLDLAALELRSTHKHGVEPTLSAAERKEVKKRFADTPVKLWGLGTSCEYHSPDPNELARQIENTKAFIKLAEDVGAVGIKVRPNGLPKEVREEKTIAQIGQSLQKVGDFAADHGVEIWLEVHGYDTAHPPRIRRMMDIADRPNVGVTWNSNYPTDLKDGSIKPYFELLRDKILSVHITELINPYPWRELFGLLNANGYDRYTLIEAQPLKCNNDEDTMRWLGYYRALWDALSRSA